MNWNGHLKKFLLPNLVLHPLTNLHTSLLRAAQSFLWSYQFSASQEIPCILRHPQDHYFVYKSPPPVPILSQINPVHAPPHTTFWKSILPLSSHLCLGLPSCIFPSGFPTKTHYTPLLSPKCATCPTHHILLDLITQIIFGEQCGSLSF